MLKHFGIYSNSGQVETAIENETLIKPYVAKVSGALDYNSYEEHVDSAWVVDSAGNTYSGTPISNSFQFEFYKPSGATWTLYYNGQVVTAATYRMHLQFICEGPYGDGDIAETNYPVQNIDTYTDVASDSPTMLVGITFTPSTMDADCLIERECCPDCEGATDSEYCCGQAGGTWDADNQTCVLPEPDPCESPETDQDICECAGGSWNDDGSDSSCDVGTCNCSANGADYSYAECVECCANGGTWTDDGEGNWHCDTGDEPSE